MNDTPDTQPGFLQRLDALMASNPWYPRVLPFGVYIAMLALIGAVQTDYPITYPVLYTIQCVVVCWLLWRYRKLTPELNIRFHWTVIPSAVLLTALWIGFGWWFAGEWGLRIGAIQAGEPLGLIDYDEAGLEDTMFSYPEAHPFMELRDGTTGIDGTVSTEPEPALYWTSILLRLLGMSLVVPLFEELFIRSAMLRGMHDRRKTGIGLIQILCDMPVIGDWLMETKLGRRAMDEPGMFTKQLEETALGSVTLFAIIASTVIFMISHVPRDWAGCVACGVVWCLMVGWTNRASLAEGKRLGLGPVVWSHGLVNALLWVYTVWSDDWQFL